MTKSLVRVLLVDDDAADAEITRITLADARTRRFEVQHADRASRALEYLRSATFDALLLDLGLPDSQGLATLQAIRDENDDIPIVVLTGLSDENTALESLDRGAQDYLVKGTNGAEILERSICYAIQRQQQHRALAVANEQLAQKNQWLQALNETARQFVDNVSHDFRTPLTVIREFASIMSEGLGGAVSDKQLEFLGIILTRVDDLALMVDDLLDVSKLEAGLLGLWRRSVQASEMIEHVRIVLERRAEAKQVGFEIVLEEPLPAVYCDVEKIGRVIVNLAVNAVKFTPAGGRVRLWAKTHDNAQEVIVGVTDTGPGISQDDVSVIFERFKQVGNQVQASGKGFGLGLNIARELVHLNLGIMQVESELGRGSTFSFTLPTAEPLRLFDRYLDCVLAHAGATPAFSATVSLLTAQIDDNGDAPALAAADGFLQTVVGSYDLVYRLEARHWALAVRCPADELGTLMQRILREWTELGENRPAGALPELRLQALGSWRADRRRAEVASAFAALAAEVAPQRAPKRVLLVDDDSDVIETLGIRLRAAGYEVSAARDGRQGVACAIQDRPDVIVLDVRMPIQDGISALGELKQRDDTRRIPVIMLSASVGHQRESKELGARFFIQKPYDASAVMSAVQSSLSEACLA